jgi:hypothetical protein
MAADRGAVGGQAAALASGGLRIEGLDILVDQARKEVVRMLGTLQFELKELANLDRSGREICAEICWQLRKQDARSR